MFRCPVCAAALRTEGGSRRCAAGHVFDIAREGYVNLLAGSSARHRRAGDDVDMIKARRLFLDAGHYAPLRDAVLAQVPAAGAVLDVGCGEGHYTRPLAGDAHDGWVGGIDLSKPGVRLAAQRERSIDYAVANAYAVPLDDGSIDCIVNVFGPVVGDETQRVLRAGGRAVFAVPGPRHLHELKTVVLDVVEEHELRGPKGLDGVLALDDMARITYEMDVAQPVLDALLAMTPLRWRTEPARAEALSAIDRMTITADFLVCVYA